jgi:hypothetical protein
MTDLILACARPRWAGYLGTFEIFCISSRFPAARLESCSHLAIANLHELRS